MLRTSWITWMLSALVALSANLAWGQAVRLDAPPRGPASRPASSEPPKLEFPLGEDAVVLELDRRYVNSVWGFSFQPPVKTYRGVDAEAVHRLTWTRFQEKTGALMWSLSVSRVSLEKAPDDLDKLARALAGQLDAQENFQVDKHRVGQAAGMKAIHLRGRSGVSPHRQSWLQTAPNQFLVFRISGPDEIFARLDKVLDLSLDSVKLVQSTAEARKQTLSAGAKVLEKLTAERMGMAIHPEPQWFLLWHEGKKAGFIRVVEAARTLQGVDGYAVRSWSLVEVPKTPVRLSRRESFVSSDRKYERWHDQWQVGSGKTADNGAERGMLQENVLLCDIDPGGGQKVRSAEFHLKAESEYYLPHVLGSLLPRLLDLSKSGSYAFSSYSGVRGFEIRTVTVVGPVTLNEGQAQVQAIKVLDQPSDDVGPSTAHYSAKGDLLRLESSDGLVVEASDAATVRKAYPKADAIVKALGL